MKGRRVEKRWRCVKLKELRLPRPKMLEGHTRVARWAIVWLRSLLYRHGKPLFGQQDGQLRAVSIDRV